MIAGAEAFRGGSAARWTRCAAQRPDGGHRAAEAAARRQRAVVRAAPVSWRRLCGDAPVRERARRVRGGRPAEPAQRRAGAVCGRARISRKGTRRARCRRLTRRPASSRAAATSPWCAAGFTSRRGRRREAMAEYSAAVRVNPSDPQATRPPGQPRDAHEAVRRCAAPVRGAAEDGVPAVAHALRPGADRGSAKATSRARRRDTGKRCGWSRSFADARAALARYGRQAIRHG